MAKYLDEAGLSYFWEKIKDRIDGFVTPLGMRLTVENR